MSRSPVRPRATRRDAQPASTSNDSKRAGTPRAAKKSRDQSPSSRKQSQSSKKAESLQSDNAAYVQSQKRGSSNTSLVLLSVVVLVLANAGYYWRDSWLSSTETFLSRVTRSAIPSCTPRACAYGVFNTNTCECQCFASNDKKNIGYCLNAEGICWTVKTYDAATREYSCPFGSKPSNGDAIWNGTHAVPSNPSSSSSRSPSASSSSSSRSTTTTTTTTTTSSRTTTTTTTTSAPSPSPSPADPAQTRDCLFGFLVNGKCQCINQNNPNEPGYCPDESGRCTIYKVWGDKGSFCPTTENCDPKNGCVIEDESDCDEPADELKPTLGCGLGRFDSATGLCACFRAHANDGLSVCLDSNARCTVLKQWNADTKQYECPSGTFQPPTSGNAPSVSGFVEHNYGCVFGTWNGGTGSCECIRSGSTTEVGFCADSNGRCTIPSVPDANNRFSCPPGSTATTPSPIKTNTSTTCTAPAIGCGFGTWDKSRCSCVCQREGLNTEPGFCLDNNGSCTVAKVVNASNLFNCPAGFRDSSEGYATFDVKKTSSSDCLHGVLGSDSRCRCWNSNDAAQPGFCLDSRGVCSTPKVWSSTSMSFYCPGDTKPSLRPDPGSNAGSSTSDLTCVYGTRVNGECKCIGEESEKSNGYCRDASGRCTIVKTYDHTTQLFSCPGASSIPVSKGGSGPEPSPSTQPGGKTGGTSSRRTSSSNTPATVISGASVVSAFNTFITFVLIASMTLFSNLLA